MRTSIPTLLLGVAIVTAPVATPVFGQSSTQSQTQTLSRQIEASVRQDAALGKYDVRVAVDGGVATLTGTVATDAQKTRAAQLARVDGITRVDNQIVVDAAAAVRGTNGTFDRSRDAAADAGERTKDAAKDVGVATKDAAKDVGGATKDAAKDIGGATKDVAKEVGEKTKDTAQTVGEKTKDVAAKIAEKTKETAVKVAEKTRDGVVKASSEVSDAAILSAVKAQFVGDDALKGSDINVDVDAHVVTLKGTVASETGRARAIAVARGVDGVQRVVDRLVIAPAK